jgi:hypothetical protein
MASQWLCSPNSVRYTIVQRADSQATSSDWAALAR